MGRGDYKTAGQWFTAGAWILGGSAVVAAFAGFLFSSWIPRIFGITGESAAILEGSFALGSIAGGLSIFNNLFLGLGISLQQTRFMYSATAFSSIVSFIITVLAIFKGAGLWAIPIGMCSRALLVFLFGVYFITFGIQREIREQFVYNHQIFKEYLRSAPATAVGGVAYALLNQSETVIVGIFIRPDIAAIYNITKRGIEIVKNVIDIGISSSFGAFAHLVGSGDFVKANNVTSEIRSLRFVISIACSGVYVAINKSFLNLWIGPGIYGGDLLTILFAIQFLIIGDTFLLNILYKGTGEVAKGSWILGLEAITRISLMIMVIQYFGQTSIPIINSIVSVIFGLILWKLLNQRLHSNAQVNAFYLRATILCASALFLALLFNHWIIVTHWLHLAIVAFSGLSFLICLGIFTMPDLQLWRLRLIKMVALWKK